MTERMPAIKQIEDDIATARASAIVGVKAFQADCPHDKVVSSGERRICVCCGLEEYNRYYFWPGETKAGGFYEFLRPAGERTILNTEFVKQGDVTQYRVRV